MYNYAFANTWNVKLAGYDRFKRSQARKCFHLAYDIVVDAGKNEFGTDMDTALLLTNRQVFDETEPILYHTLFIQIGVYLHKGLEFLKSLSPRARRNIRAVHIALPYRCICGLGIDHNLQYWGKLCTYMSQNLQLRALSFNVSVKAVPANFADQAWVKYLIKIRELKDLVQRSDSGSNSELGPEPNQVPSSRYQASMLSYLRSEMCLLPASRLLTGKEEK